MQLITITTTKKIAITDEIILFVFLLLKLNIWYTSFLKGLVMKFLLLPSITILILVLNHNIRKNKNKEKKSVKSYLAREDRANSARRKDLSNLPYIEIPLNTLPLDITLNDEKKQLQISNYIKEIRFLSEKQMLNLIGVSNTELKEEYGPANLELLTIYDQNYSRYIRNLHLLAECIYEEYPNEAVALWEYCLDIGTDISGTYACLGQHYVNLNKQELFMKLYDYIPSKTSISGKTIINKLDNMKEQFQ